MYHSLACLDRTWRRYGVRRVSTWRKWPRKASQRALWGLYMDFDQQVISLPEPKRMKAKYLLTSPSAWQPAPCDFYWSTVCPEMVPRLPALYRPTRGLETKTTSSAAAEEQAGADMNDDDWEDFWRTLDFIRLQLERPLGTSFRASFEKLLPFRERLAVPGVLPSPRRRRHS